MHFASEAIGSSILGVLGHRWGSFGIGIGIRRTVLHRYPRHHRQYQNKGLLFCIKSRDLSLSFPDGMGDPAPIQCYSKQNQNGIYRIMFGKKGKNGTLCPFHSHVGLHRIHLRHLEPKFRRSPFVTVVCRGKPQLLPSRILHPFPHAQSPRRPTQSPQRRRRVGSRGPFSIPVRCYPSEYGDG